MLRAIATLPREYIPEDSTTLSPPFRNILAKHQHSSDRYSSISTSIKYAASMLPVYCQHMSKGVFPRQNIL